MLSDGSAQASLAEARAVAAFLVSWHRAHAADPSDDRDPDERERYPAFVGSFTPADLEDAACLSALATAQTSSASPHVI